jgi:hypothetical protein
MESEKKIPMEKIFDEIFYVRRFRKNILLITASTYIFLVAFLIWFMWSLFDMWTIYYGPTDPIQFLIIGAIIGGILGLVWAFRARDLKRGIPYLLRPKKHLFTKGFFRKKVYSKLGTVPKLYYNDQISLEEKEKDLLIWESNKRIGIGLKALLYLFCIVICIVAMVLVNFFSWFLGLLTLPLTIVIIMVLVVIASITPTTIRSYYCLSPIYFTYWILKNWSETERIEPYGMLFKPLYLNLSLLSKNYLNLELKEINEIVSHLYTYYIIRREKQNEVVLDLDKRMQENLNLFDQFLKTYAIEYKQYLAKGKTLREQWNYKLDRDLESCFFKFLLIIDEIQKYNITEIGEINLKFKIDWKHRLLNNFSRLTLSSSVATILSIVGGLLYSIL